jgi:hypothetical protein
MNVMLDRHLRFVRRILEWLLRPGEHPAASAGGREGCRYWRRPRDEQGISSTYTLGYQQEGIVISFAAPATSAPALPLEAIVPPPDVEAAILAERCRIADILGHHEAIGRAALALHIATKTAQTVDGAVAILAHAPRARPVLAVLDGGGVAGTSEPESLPCA